MAKDSKIYWNLVFIVSFGMLVLLVLCHVLFVAYYAHLMNPGHDQEYYRQFAQNTGAAFVFFFAPLPVFLAVRWVGHKAQGKAIAHAGLIVAVMVILDVSIVTLAGKADALLSAGQMLAHIAKAAAALLGGWIAERNLALD